MSERPPPRRPPVKPKNLKFARALFNFESNEKGDLNFKMGDLLYIIEEIDGDWWRARLKDKEGLVPANYFPKKEDLNPLLDACRRGNLDLLEECLLMKIPLNASDLTGNIKHYLLNF